METTKGGSVSNMPPANVTKPVGAYVEYAARNKIETMTQHEVGPWFGRAMAALRIAIGGVFLWAFLDKLLGLGFATKPESAWVRGGSPTFGFLNFGTSGPFAEVYQAMAGNAVVDALFMLGLVGVGVALVLGVGMRVAAASGVTMMLLMWSAALPPANNPVLDDHIIYALVLVVLALGQAGRVWGLGDRWQRTRIVERYPVLE